MADVRAKSRFAVGVTAMLTLMLMVPSSVPPASAYGRTGAPLHGVTIYLNDLQAFSTDQLLSQATKAFDYIGQLHANAVQLAFPFSVVPSNDYAPVATPGAPTPHQLELIIDAATALGLNVQLRPLLLETSVGPSFFRGDLQPRNTSLWFRRYFSFLEPYLRVAEATKVSSFVISSELARLAERFPAQGSAVPVHRQLWNQLLRAARTQYHGVIIASHDHNHMVPISGTVFGDDAYVPAVNLPANAPLVALVRAVTANWKFGSGYLEPLPTPFTSDWIEEVWIAPYNGAFHTPWQQKYPGGVFNRNVQAKWFLASCTAARSLHVAALYYWMIDLAYFTPGRASSDPGQWQYTPTAKVVENCFAAG